MTFLYRNGLEKVGEGAVNLVEKVEKTVEEKVKDVVDDVKGVVSTAKSFYKHHKAWIFAVETAVLIGTGLVELEVIQGAFEMCQAGSVAERTVGLATELGEATVSGIRGVTDGVLDSLAEIDSWQKAKSAASNLGSALETMMPYIKRFVKDQVLKKAKFASSQLLIMLGHAMIAAIVKSNDTEKAAQIEHILRDSMRDTVNARLEKLVPPKEMADTRTFLKDVRTIQYMPYNSNGYGANSLGECLGGSNEKCFEDPFLKDRNKQICTVWEKCYGDYAGVLRHGIEMAYPIKAYEKASNNKNAMDQIDGSLFNILLVLHVHS